jgi:sugar/nucleoside kinase (ribokinase family)
VLDRADLVGVSEHDLPPGTDPLSLLTLLRRGAQLAVTRGADGGELLQAGRAPQRYASVVGGDEVDATGAGDVFLATLAAVRLRPILADGADGLTVAAGAASLAVERPGLAGVPRLEDVRSRLATIASRGGLRD